MHNRCMRGVHRIADPQWTFDPPLLGLGNIELILVMYEKNTCRMKFRREPLFVRMALF